MHNVGKKPGQTSKKDQDQEAVQVDGVIGDFGGYQLLVCLFKVLIGVTSAFNNLGVTFFAPTKFVGYSCATESGNSTLIAADHSTKSPLDPIGLVSSLLSGEARSQKHLAIESLMTPIDIRRNCTYRSVVDKQSYDCSSYNYDTGIWLSTIIEEWDLVCSRAWLTSWTQSLYMSGFIVSYLVFGYLSDRFGRWNSLLIGSLFEIIAGLGCAFSTSVSMFMVFRFFVGFGCAGRSSSTYLIMVEWVGPKSRVYVSTLGTMGWVVGYCLLPWISSYFLHFRHMQLFVCIYEALIIVWLFWLPESPRWLLTHKKFDKAHESLLRAARFNGLIRDKTPDEITTPKSTSLIGTQLTQTTESISSQPDAAKKPTLVSTIDEFNLKFRDLKQGVESKEFSKNEYKLSIVDLFKWTNLRWYAIVLYFVWAANSFIYYGIALNMDDFGGSNLFVAFTIAGLSELPSIAFSLVFMKMMPRRSTNILLYCTVGTLCALQLPFKYYEYKTLQQTTILLAKIFNSCAFNVLLYQTMELFPTSIRQTAYSSCCLAGRIGSILAPFIKVLNRSTNEYVGLVMFVFLSVVTCIIVTQLPETKDSDFQDTLKEAEEFKGTEKKTEAIKLV